MYSKCTLHFICLHFFKWCACLHGLLHLDSVQIPSLDISHLTFLYVLNYVALLKHMFNLTLHYSTHLIFCRKYIFVCVSISDQLNCYLVLFGLPNPLVTVRLSLWFVCVCVHCGIFLVPAPCLTLWCRRCRWLNRRLLWGSSPPHAPNWTCLTSRASHLVPPSMLRPI